MLKYLKSTVNEVNKNTGKSLRKLLNQMNPPRVVTDSAEYEEILKDRKRSQKVTSFNLKELDNGNFCRGKTIDAVRSQVKLEL